MRQNEARIDFRACLFRMKEQRDRADREHQEELDHYLKTTKDLKSRIDEQQRQVDEKQVGHGFTTKLWRNG